VTRAAGVEPVRTSVVGSGRPVSVRPPAAVISRPVVAVRTPPAPVRSIEQRQAQAGGHLNEQVLVRPVGPARPAPSVTQNARPQQTNQEGFRSFGQQGGGNNAEDNDRVKPMLRPQPRVYEQQGSALEENRNVQPNRNIEQPENREAQPPRQNREFRPPQQQQAPQETHPLVRPAPPVQQRTQQQEQQQEQKFNQWHEQRQSSRPEQQKQQSRPEPQRQDKPKK